MKNGAFICQGINFLHILFHFGQTPLHTLHRILCYIFHYFFVVVKPLFKTWAQIDDVSMFYVNDFKSS